MTRAWAIGTLVLAICLVLALCFGSDAVSLKDALAGVGPARAIVLQVRLPEALLAAIAGAGLSATGAALQALLRNPLAEPYLLGVSGGAALGATSAIALGLPLAGLLGAALAPAAAFAGGLCATAVVAFVARRVPEGGSGGAMLLAGVMVNAICASLITVAKVVLPPDRTRDILRWLVGSVELPSPLGLCATAAYAAAGTALLLRDAGRLNLLALGDESAAALGLDVAAIERRVLWSASLAIGAIVSMTGLIGFVGLVVPHALRRAVGPDLRRVLPLSCAAGAAMLVCCDLLARVMFGVFGTKLPVGAVTALIGGPAFLYLLTRGRS